jgi:diguanylate cyclase (GGDEF)-like protein
MAAFFADQLDFILFFYGLAFILLGAVCFSVARSEPGSIPWAVLGTFAYLHGANEWLDLLALIFNDTPPFAIIRVSVMIASFAALLEFGRIDAVRLELRPPGRWIYLPLLILIAAGGYLAGAGGANVVARYVLALPGAAIAAIMIAIRASRLPRQQRHWLRATAVGFGLYGLAAGAIVPPVPDWSGDVFNYEFFVTYTAMPVQFVRGLLACLVAFSIWGYWRERLIVDLASAAYATFQRNQFYRTLIALGVILVAGWILTQVLGDIYKRHIEQESNGDISLIASRLAAETTATDGMVKALASSDTIERLAAGGARDSTAQARAKATLTLDMEAARASDGYVIDRNGRLLVAAEASNIGPNHDFSDEPYFKLSIGGARGYHFKFDALDNSPNYYASYSLRDAQRDINGVVVLKKSLMNFETDLKSFDRSFALIDRDGIVLVTNRPSMRFRTLWPLSPNKIKELAPIYGSVSDRPVLKREIIVSQWLAFDGERDFVQRIPVAPGDWSLVTWKTPQGIFASRVLGIIITLQLTIIALVYLVGRERRVHDKVELEKRLGLEELARNLDYRAATDPLTGLFNRRKFDRSLANEIMRAQRYQTPLSLVLFDIDRFKLVNDRHGHQAGDNVLVELSRYAAAHIRASDVLARWGGEEFAILCPGIDGAMACDLAGHLRDGFNGLNHPGVGAVTCSFGVVEFDPSDTAVSLLARADAALYRAKANGRDRIEQAPPPKTGVGTMRTAG